MSLTIELVRPEFAAVAGGVDIGKPLSSNPVQPIHLHEVRDMRHTAAMGDGPTVDRRGERT